MGPRSNGNPRIHIEGNHSLLELLVKRKYPNATNGRTALGPPRYSKIIKTIAYNIGILNEGRPKIDGIVIRFPSIPTAISSFRRDSGVASETDYRIWKKLVKLRTWAMGT